MTRYRGRVFFIEESIKHEGPDKLEMNVVKDTNVLIVTPLLSANDDSSQDTRLRELLGQLLEMKDITDYIAWYYTPMALKFTDHLHPTLTVYDCMDELSAFKFAPPDLKSLELRLLQQADIDGLLVGGASLDPGHFVAICEQASELAALHD